MTHHEICDSSSGAFYRLFIVVYFGKGTGRYTGNFFYISFMHFFLMNFIDQL